MHGTCNCGSIRLTLCFRCVMYVHTNILHKKEKLVLLALLKQHSSYINEVLEIIERIR
uniref:Uncharacterized protein n=1 Tax=Nelumbo nucifera TaxID=4432 RepID=A0A822ZH26_NELNU|nr:TPA_asm: hypothetical protein HUJ06_015291 [Nelumbo nucifera]